MYSSVKKLGTVLLAFCMVFQVMCTGAYAAEAVPAKAGIFEGQDARFSYGSVFRTSEGETYEFSGKDTGWMQMYCYNYQTGKSYIGGARELAGPQKRYRIKTSEGSFVGYCIEHGVMVDGNLQLESSQARSSVIAQGLGETVMQNIKLCLLYGRQNGDSIYNLLDSPEDGGLGFRDSEFFQKNSVKYTLDDWEIATVMLIRESQQKFRDSRFRLKSEGNGLSYTDSWRGNETGTINKDHYVKPLKGKAAYDIYRYMEKLCQQHYVFPTAIAGLDADKPKEIVFSSDDVDAAGNYVKQIAVSASRACQVKAVLKDNPAEAAEGINIAMRKEGDKLFYEITASPEAVKSGSTFALSKVITGRVPANDMLVWERETDKGHIQAITTGADDPLQGYFRFAEKEAPAEGEAEPPEPEYFPVFEFPVSKTDFNPGWDGDISTPMGDASLAATYALYRDGEEVDRVTLSDYGQTEILCDQPWTNPGDLAEERTGQTGQHMISDGGDPPEMADHGCGIQEPVNIRWTGNHTYTVREIPPEGRFTEPDAFGGIREYKVSYEAESHDQRSFACEEAAWTDVIYDVKYETVAGSGAGGQSGPASIETLEEVLAFGEETFVNDNYRGKLTLSKSLEREDVFKESPMGGQDESVKSGWKLYLASGGFENHPYVNFTREKDLTDGTAVYRVTRDSSGSNNCTDEMKIGSNGELIIHDIPFGMYYMEETTADDGSYVRERFKVEIGEHSGTYTPEDDYDNRYDYNVRDKKITNKVKIIKTDSETGKGVDLAGTKFYIRYKGSPLNTDAENQILKNYNRYLPDAEAITSDGPYTFEADENGELTIKYEIPYGIYEILEWQVPEGYTVSGENNVYTFTVNEQPLHTDGNFGQKVDYRGKITAADGDYNPDIYTYTARLATVAMANKAAKGRIEIIKTDKQGNYLAGSTFGIFAAEDVMLSDGNEGPEIFDSRTGKKIVIPLKKSTHYGSPEGIYEEGLLRHYSGAELWYLRERESGNGGPAGEDNRYVRKYITPEHKNTSYTTAFQNIDDRFISDYTAEVTMNYQAGGTNITSLLINKVTVPVNGAEDFIPVTEPAGTVEEAGGIISINPLISYVGGGGEGDSAHDEGKNSLSVKKACKEEKTPEGKISEITQTYEITYVQKSGNDYGFEMSWDGFSLRSQASADSESAVTEITSPGSEPVAFTESVPASPVYFMSEDGIRSEMYSLGGAVKARFEIPQSAVDKDFGMIVPEISVTGLDGVNTALDWYSCLTPSEPVQEFNPEGGIKITASRIDHQDTGKAESYVIEAVTTCGEESPVNVHFADGYTMTFYAGKGTGDMDAGIMIIDGEYKTTRYNLSEPVEVITTDSAGKGISSLLPLGRYIVRELDAPCGYVAVSEGTEVNLSYENQTVPVVLAGVERTNEAVLTEIQLMKGFETGHESGIFVPGKGGIFGVYEGGSGKLIGRVESADGGLALGNFSLEADKTYYVKEISAPDGYVPCSIPFYFAVSDETRRGACSFDYPEEGVSGQVVMDGFGRGRLIIRVLTRYPEEKLTINNDTFRINREKDLTETEIFLAEGQPAEVILGSGRKITAEVSGNTFTYDFDGMAGVYIPRVNYTGYIACAEHQWKETEQEPETETETLVFRGAGMNPDIVTAEIIHEAGENGFVHRAVINEGTDLPAGEKISFAGKGNEQWAVSLDEKGKITVAVSGIIKGELVQETEPAAELNGTVLTEDFTFFKSVSLLRQNSHGQTMQVIINTSDNVNPFMIENSRKKNPDPAPVPEIPVPLPQLPEQPEEPEPETPDEPDIPAEPEAPNPYKSPELADVPKTGGRGPCLELLAALLLIAGLFALMIRKENFKNAKKEN